MTTPDPQLVVACARALRTDQERNGSGYCASAEIDWDLVAETAARFIGSYCAKIAEERGSVLDGFDGAYATQRRLEALLIAQSIRSATGAAHDR